MIRCVARQPHGIQPLNCTGDAVSFTSSDYAKIYTFAERVCRDFAPLRREAIKVMVMCDTATGQHRPHDAMADYAEELMDVMREMGVAP